MHRNRSPFQAFPSPPFSHSAIPACFTGCLALIDDPNLSDEKLRRIIPAPDFPTGGEIMGLDGAAKLYTTGNDGPTYIGVIVRQIGSSLNRHN